MDDGVAIRMEVQPFLPHRCRGEHERPKRRVECGAHLVLTCAFGGFRVVFPQPTGEARAHAVIASLDGWQVPGARAVERREGRAPDDALFALGAAVALAFVEWLARRSGR